MRSRLRSLIDEWRPAAVTAGEPFYPLAVMFGLNAVDELDRTAFAVLLPDIRDHFGLGDAGALALVAVSTVAVIAVEVPLSFYVDRARRVRIAVLGAATWALFSLGTGLAFTVAVLAAARIGSGIGRSVVNPTHHSLLSDWYPPRARVKVFGVHRIANSTGQILGPLVAGGVGLWLGWRWPFILFVVPTVAFIVLAMRLREPVRGFHERREAGADERVAATEEQPAGVRETMRILWRIPTMRRVWMAVPFLAIALFGVPNLLALVYEDVFGLNAAQRGAVTAGAEPLQIVGIVVGLPIAHRLVARDPGLLLGYAAVIGIIDGILLGVLAYAPNVGVAIAIHMLVSLTIATLAPAFYAGLSLISPPRVRAVGFTVLSLFGIPGIAVVLPLIGVVSDAFGLQASMLIMVPVSLASGFILASARKTVAGDVERVQAEARAAAEASASAAATLESSPGMNDDA